MRITLLIISILTLTLNIKAELPGQYPFGQATSPILYTYLTGITVFTLVKAIEPEKHGLIISGSADPSMLVNFNAIDTRYRVSYYIGNFEPFVMYENVPTPYFYNAFSMGILYKPEVLSFKQLHFLIGPERTLIWNRGVNTDWFRKVSYGINGEIRIKLSKNLTIDISANHKQRFDRVAHNWQFSGYIGGSFHF